ncbi:peptidylprolyl isomerase [Clostridium sp.]|uniref:peptidylprolyl isomerase n=1 Tax=Clostridium sp. TaxID=1506 RepID=UPI001A44DF67|nr:peptidylprolyl isomerase [Clostridium sp.]MBK5239739.1 peptidylprolyl isomerase [Clostridium sp.]
MKNVKKIISIALITMVTTSLIGCNMIEKTPEGVAKSVVAKVFDTKITRGEVDIILEGVIPQIEEQYGENYASNTEAMDVIATQKTQILESLIQEKIINYKANELKVMPTEEKLNEEINKQLEIIKAGYETDEAFQEELKNYNTTEAKLKENIKPSVISTALITEVTKDVKVNEAEEKVYYGANPFMYTEEPNRVQVAHILVATPEEAAAIKKLLDEGGDFAALAKEKSIDTASKEAGGDLGFVEYTETQIDQTFLAAAIATEKGKVSEPITTDAGVHLIKVLEKEEYDPKKFEDVKDEIQETLLAQGKEKTWSDTMLKWQEEGKITKYEKNL